MGEISTMESMELKKKLEKKKIFITGHNGFKGTWLTFYFGLIGSQIKGYSLKPKTNNKKFFYELNSKNKYLFEEFGDIRDLKKLSKSINEFKPDIVYHFASQSIVLDAIKDPVDNFEINTIGLVNVLESCKNCKSVQSIVIATSDKCYLNKDKKINFTENDKLGGKEPYAASKACQEIISTAYYETYFKEKKIGLTTVRAGNVVGFGDFSNYRLIPDIFKSIENKKKLIIRNKNSTRPWQYILDVIGIYVKLGCMLNSYPLKYSTAFNVSISNNRKYLSVKDIIDLIEKKLQIKLNVKYLKTRNNESKYLQLNSRKINNYLNFKNKFNAQKTIIQTFKDYFDHKNNKKLYYENISKFVLENYLK